MKIFVLIAAVEIFLSMRFEVYYSMNCIVKNNSALKRLTLEWRYLYFQGIVIYMYYIYKYYKNIEIWRIKKDISISLLPFFSIEYKRKLILRRKQDKASDFWYNAHQLSPLTTSCWPMESDFCPNSSNSSNLSLHMIPVSYTHLTLPTICSV